MVLQQWQGPASQAPLASLGNEVEDFLTEKAQQFLISRMRENPSSAIPWKDIFRALDGEIHKHELPLSDDGVRERATRAACEILQLVVNEHRAT